MWSADLVHGELLVVGLEAINYKINLICWKFNDFFNFMQKSHKFRLKPFNILFKLKT